MIHAARMCRKFIMPLKVAVLSALVLVLLSSMASAQTLPSLIHETEGGIYIGTWTWNGHGYNASWTNGALAVLTVQSFTQNSVVIDRTDIPGSVSYGVVGVYTGQISSDGNSIVNGVLNWTYRGNSFSEAWTGSWALQVSVALLDPVPTLFVPTTSTITSDLNTLASGGTGVSAVAADGVAKLLVRVTGLVPGEQINVSILNENGTPAPANGEDGTLSDLIAGTAGSGIVSPVPQAVNGKYDAFVLYQSPIDFVRASSLGFFDTSTASRQLTIQVMDSNSFAVLFSKTFKLLRPPVFFVHGLWGDPSTWDQFALALNKSINEINIYRADFATTNGDGVIPNTILVMSQAIEYLNDFKTANNAAASQLDFIVHSMGGLISNTMHNLPAFRGPANYGQGMIHKLITYDTPYQGSPLATNLAPSSTSCKDLMKMQGSVVGGAVEDLVVGSPFLQSFDPHPSGYAKHAIASEVTAAQASQVEAAINTAETSLLLRGTGKAQIVDACSSVLETLLTPEDHFVFSVYFQSINDPYDGANDLVVSEKSQLGPYTIGTTADSTSGLAHSHAVLPFIASSALTLIPGSLDAGVGTPVANTDLGIKLLNSPTIGPLFLQ